MSANNNLIAKIIALIIGLLLAGSFCLAQADTVEDIANIKSILKKTTTSINAKNIKSTPINGLYEVYVDGTIFYMDKTTSYVLLGSTLIDDTSKKNLTAERLKELTHINFAELPFQNAIEIKKGSGVYKFAVFTDPDCPYCKALEQSLAKSEINDYTAYIFLYPLKELHPDAASKAESIWCAKDRVQAWKNWMLNGIEPVKANCINPLASNEKLTKELDVSGTPTIYLNDGHLSRNFEELTEAINSKK